MGGGGGGTLSRPSQDFMSCEGRQIYELEVVVRGLFSSALFTISESMYALLLPTLSRKSKAFSEILIVMACFRPVEGRPVPNAVPAFMVLEWVVSVKSFIHFNHVVDESCRGMVSYIFT